VSLAIRNASKSSLPSIHGTTLEAQGISGTVGVYDLQGHVILRTALVQGRANLGKVPEGIRIVRLPDGQSLLWSGRGNGAFWKECGGKMRSKS
jgi:hypothetical protein